jgi:hypothetical protein
LGSCRRLKTRASSIDVGALSIRGLKMKDQQAQQQLMLERMQACEMALSKARWGKATEEDWFLIWSECGLADRFIPCDPFWSRKMSLIAKDNGESGFTPVPPGMHLARCYRVIDLGTQKTEYQGTIKYAAKVLLQFEVHGEDENGQPLVTSKGEPMTIGKRLTLSLAEKSTLRKDLSNWRGRDFTPEELRGFELKNLLNVWAMISVSRSVGNNGKEYTNIATINPVPPALKKQGLPQGFNPAGIFAIANPDMELFETFSERIKETIVTSPEWTSKRNPPEVKKTSAAGFEDMVDDIPF